MDNEKFAPLKMAGVEGNITAILTDDNLLLERSDSKGMRIELESITRLRHHHVAFTPPLLTFFGVLSILASLRVFTGDIQIYSFILGVSSLLAWLLGRRPALCIDTKQGDRHLLHGRDHLLQRIYIILDRMSDGCTLEDAVIGLDEIIQPELSLVGDIDEVRSEAGFVAAANARTNIEGAKEQSLEQALAELQQSRSSISIPVETTEYEIPKTPQPTMDSAYERVWGRETPQWYSERDRKPEQNTVFDRSTRALAEQKEAHAPTATNYEAPFQLPNFNVPDSATNTTPNSPPPVNRAQAAAQQASEANFDMGGMFGMFDELDSFSESVNTPHSPNSLPEPTTTLPALSQQSWQLPSETPTTSYAMLTAAAGPNLPEPTRVALRPDLPTSPGLVASAAINAPEEKVQPLPEQLRKSFEKVSKPNPLSNYPALNRMQKHYARESRIRVNKSYRRRRSALKTIGQWVKPGLKRIEQSGKEISKKITGAGDGYASVYGDEDGNTGDAYQEANMHTTQILRLRADQDSQSDVQARLRLLTMNGGGAIADDLANRTLRGISSSSKSEGFTLKGDETKKLTAPKNFSGMVSSNEPAPRFAGMQRLG
ncbi:MAG: hypothetical protein HOE69_08205 [Euryarchaeota archaeon]|nr:hypothetical protein [Euryarchaeota archaeon]